MIRINVHDQGLQEAQRALQELEKVCGGIAGPNTVELHSKERKDGADANNEEILEWLTKYKADFVSLTNNEDKNRVFQPIADEVTRRMQIALSAQGQGIDEMKAGEIRAAALMKGGKAYAELVVERFKDQRPAKGTISPPDPDYAEKRYGETKVGKEVVGINTGDLLDNISAAQFRLTRR